MIRVLFIGMNNQHGGVETFSRNVQKELEGKEFHFSFLNRFKNNGMSDYEEIKSTNSEIYDVYEGKFRYLTRYHNAKRFFKKNNDFDVVHLNALTLNSIFWLRAAKKYKVKKLIIHSHIDYIKYNSFLKKIIASVLFNINKAYLKNNPEIIKLSASYNAGQWMFGREKFEILNNGIDVNKYRFELSKREKVRENLGIDFDKKVICVVARMTYQKNYERILSIFKRISSNDDSYRLIILGDGDQREFVKDYIKTNNLESRVLMVGEKNNVNDYLCASDCMLMPSRFEALPFAIIEAQSSGVPCVVSKKVIPEDADVTGKIAFVDLSDEDTIWMKHIDYFMKQRNDYKERSKMNKNVLLSKYNNKNSIKSLIRIYNKEK